MRGVHSVVDDIRRNVFAEVARLAYQGGDYSGIDQIPFKMIPGGEAKYRQDVFIERAIIAERVRLACGLPTTPADEYAVTSVDIKKAAVPEKYYEPPLVNVIPFACNACPPKMFRISSNCQGCLSRPCQAVCPKKAISTDADGKSVIDQTLCVKCGKCMATCPYNAISRMERPCAKACGMDAIGSDEKGKAKIDYSKCVSCGQCLVNCPFAAIADKSQIFQLVTSICDGDEVIAIVAPAFVGQFGPNVSVAKLRKAMRVVGFKDVQEVAIGADICTVDEANEFIERVPEKQPFMLTSCCPAWSVMAKKLFPEFSDLISMTLTPMVITARMLKKEHPNAKIAFIGPCSAKKLEASRKEVRSDVDFVLTFEELQGIFTAKNIDFATIVPDAEDEEFLHGTGAGRGFAVGGGVAAAVADVISQIAPELEVKTEYGDGLRQCRKMLAFAKAGMREGYLLEGMGCVGGCVAGAGTIAPVPNAAAYVKTYKTRAPKRSALESDYLQNVEELMK